MKKAWNAPALEVLDAQMTMAGKGAKFVDSVTVSDLDITDTPPIS